MPIRRVYGPIGLVTEAGKSAGLAEGAERADAMSLRRQQLAEQQRQYNLSLMNRERDRRFNAMSEARRYGYGLRSRAMDFAGRRGLMEREAELRGERERELHGFDLERDDARLRGAEVHELMRRPEYAVPDEELTPEGLDTRRKFDRRRDAVRGEYAAGKLDAAGVADALEMIAEEEAGVEYRPVEKPYPDDEPPGSLIRADLPEPPMVGGPDDMMAYEEARSEAEDEMRRQGKTPGVTYVRNKDMELEPKYIHNPRQYVESTGKGELDEDGNVLEYFDLNDVPRVTRRGQERLEEKKAEVEARKDELARRQNMEDEIRKQRLELSLATKSTEDGEGPAYTTEEIERKLKSAYGEYYTSPEGMEQRIQQENQEAQDALQRSVTNQFAAINQQMRGFGAPETQVPRVPRQGQPQGMPAVPPDEPQPPSPIDDSIYIDASMPEFERAFPMPENPTPRHQAVRTQALQFKEMGDHEGAAILAELMEMSLEYPTGTPMPPEVVKRYEWLVANRHAVGAE